MLSPMLVARDALKMMLPSQKKNANVTELEKQNSEQATGSMLMKNNEITTEPAEMIDGSLSMTGRDGEILRSALSVLPKMYELADETPENSLIGHSTRLMNVAHSLVEEREKNYLEGTTQDNTRKIDHDDLTAIIQLSAAARENIKLAMDIKKDKSKLVIDMIAAMKK